jgi:hypothetical protein
MLLLAPADTLAGGAQTATTVTCTVFGMELNAGVETYKVLDQRQLASTVATIYTAPASTAAFIRSIVLVNTNAGASQTFQLFRGGTAAANAITPLLTIPAGGMAVYEDGEGWKFYNSSGQLLGQGASGGTPAVVFGAAAAAGVSPLFLRIDDTIDAFDGVTPVNIAAAAVVGANAFCARSDHTHTIGAGIVTRAMQEATGKGWQFLGTATGNGVTVGPVIWTGTFQQFMVDYHIAGYNGGTPVGRLLFGAASISTTALTNGTGIRESVAAATAAISIPGIPLAVTLSNIARSGTVFVRGASGALKTYEVTGSNGNPSVSVARTTFEGSGSFSDLGTNLPLQRMQLSVYDTLVATALSAQTFTAGTYLTVWGRNND